MKRSLACLSVLALLVGLGAARLAAGEKKKSDKKDEGPPPVAKPGPEHQVLAGMAGTFDAKVTIFAGPDKTIESKGTIKRQMVLDGRYLKEDYEGDFFGASFKGMGITGYDQNQKKYVSTWIDTMSTGITSSTGTYDAATKTLSSTGEDFDAEAGRKVKIRDVLKIVSNDEQQSEMYREVGGKEVKVMEIRFTRSAKAIDKKVEKKKAAK